MLAQKSTISDAVITNVENFHTRVKLLRNLLKLSQADFSKWLWQNYRIEVSRETVNLWESSRLPGKSFRNLFFVIIDQEIENLEGDHEYR